MGFVVKSDIAGVGGEMVGLLGCGSGRILLYVYVRARAAETGQGWGGGRCLWGGRGGMLGGAGGVVRRDGDRMDDGGLQVLIRLRRREEGGKGRGALGGGTFRGGVGVGVEKEGERDNEKN